VAQVLAFLEKAPSLTASLKVALPWLAIPDPVWNKRRLVSSSWVSWLTGVAAISHRYLDRYNVIDR
jgi:hypothetical protein